MEKYQGSEDLPENFWPDVGPTPSAHKVYLDNCDIDNDDPIKQQAGAKGECRRIRGTDGTLQMPGFDKQEVRS